MNASTRILVIVAVAVSFLAGCTDRKTEQQMTAADAAAKARADNARKEMEKLPATFKPRYNKKLEPDVPKALPAQEKTATPSK